VKPLLVRKSGSTRKVGVQRGPKGSLPTKDQQRGKGAKEGYRNSSCKERVGPKKREKDYAIRQGVLETTPAFNTQGIKVPFHGVLGGLKLGVAVTRL